MNDRTRVAIVLARSDARITADALEELRGQTERDLMRGGWTDEHRSWLRTYLARIDRALSTVKDVVDDEPVYDAGSGPPAA